MKHILLFISKIVLCFVSLTKAEIDHYLSAASKSIILKSKWFCVYCYHSIRWSTLWHVLEFPQKSVYFHMHRVYCYFLPPINILWMELLSWYSSIGKVSFTERPIFFIQTTVSLHILIKSIVGENLCKVVVAKKLKFISSRMNKRLRRIIVPYFQHKYALYKAAHRGLCGRKLKNEDCFRNCFIE